MSEQAKNLCGICRGSSESTIRMALDMVSESVRNEIINHYGGNIDTAVTHLRLGTK